MACCIGQVVRSLAYDGVDSNQLYGSDLEQRFLDIGYEMFRDKETLKSTFVTGDVLQTSADGSGGDERLNVLNRKINIVHAQSFFHLFTWEDQVKAAKRIIKFLKLDDPDVVIFGRQVGSAEPGNMVGVRGNNRFLHNAASWQQLWDEVGKGTGTKWRTEVNAVELTPDVLRERIGKDFNARGANIIRFGVYRA
jgi:hypothetical protein